MLAVIFELEPVAERKQDYLDLAAQLGRQLESIDGFISIERFESLAQPGKLLSLSFWRDEAAISAWRNLEQHRAAQRAGRSGIMSDYRLRVATVIRDYDMQNRGSAPDDSNNFHQ
jgi:heme-degrading monooxygenase HmoA